MSITTASILSLVKLTNRYCYQLLHGCERPECGESLCATGQRNISPPGRPVRQWTPRSARAIALALAGHPAPTSHLCPYCPDSSYLGEPLNVALHQESSPRDNSSLMQQLCDTEVIKTVTSGEVRSLVQLAEAWQSDTPDDLEERIKNHKQLDALRFGTMKRSAAAASLARIFMTVVGDAEPEDLAALVDAARLTSNGRALPDYRTRSPEHYKTLLSFLDELQDEPANRLVNKVFTTLFAWTRAEEQAGLLEHEYLPRLPGDFRLVEDFATVLAGMYRVPPISAKIAAWTQRVFLKHWRSQPTISDPAAVAALQFLQAFWSCPEHEMDKLIDRSWVLRIVPHTLEDIEVARTWLSPGVPGRHVLSFPILFTTMERIQYFRAINALRMQDAYSEVEANIRFRASMPRQLPDDAILPPAIKNGEQHYLLLNVSRDNVLRDAYNQLWQRRKGELLRPLRVRLGEVEQLEIGQDLGGVQIETFNLICESLFAEELGMFTALDPTTGMHYFRFGSLQPLYMFELAGLLLALAMFNGITLPVRLPRVFYQRLLRPSMEIPEDLHRTLDLFQDGWPAEDRAMEALLTAQTPEELMQDYVFPFEANGLRGAAFLPDSAETVHILRIVDSMPAVQQSTIVAEWPGWLVMGPETDRPAAEIITRFNRAQYVRDYVNWVTYLSVRPQWDAFAVGFGRIFDSNFGRKSQGPLSADTSFDLKVHLGPDCQSKRNDLAMFDAVNLRAYVEGSSNLDINQLRAGTRYDGYDPGSPYIDFFWNIVSDWSHDKQKQLLKFVTAAERLPFGGARNITFVVQRVDLGPEGGDEYADLPTSSTCFGTLMLPVYANRDILERKMGLAVELGCEGFGTG